jgi:hypothetical protein
LAARKLGFPTWWQALILIVAGVVIFFSSCAGALSGIGGGGNHYPQSLIATGLIAGAAMFVIGVVLMIVVVILAVARGFRRVPEAPAPSVPGAAIPQVPFPTPQQAEREIIWRLRIAIFVVLAFAVRGVFALTFALQRWPSTYSRYLGIVAVWYLLIDAPYVFALVRLARGYDLVGLTTAISAPCFNLIFWAWQLVSLISTSHARFNSYSFYNIATLTPLLDLLVIIFAWQVFRLRRLDEQQKKMASIVFAVVGVYLIVAHVALIHMRPFVAR